MKIRKIGAGILAACLILSGSAKAATCSTPACNLLRYLVRCSVFLPSIRGNQAMPQATASPTARPTAAPTARPTAAPTARPTAAPTARPTAAPTARPTAAPTARPTAAPTARPTAAPTARPTAAPTARPTAVPTASDAVSDEAKEVLRLTNAERAKYGLSPLTLDTNLSRVAQEKAEDMKRNNYFSHTSPTYGSPFDMMKAYGISYRYAAENIAMGHKTPQAVVEGWMNSEGHRKNILNANYRKLGVGYVASGKYWVQMFTD